MRGENMPNRKFASPGSRTHNHRVTSPTRSPLSHPSEAQQLVVIVTRTVANGHGLDTKTTIQEVRFLHTLKIIQTGKCSTQFGQSKAVLLSNASKFRQNIKNAQEGSVCS